MDRLYKIIKGVADDGPYKSASFKSFATKFRNDWKKELAKIDAELTSWTPGHYDVSGFFRTQDGQCWYFSLLDIRYFRFGEMLYRKAKNERDYTGKANQYIKIESGMIHKMKLS